MAKKNYRCTVRVLAVTAVALLMGTTSEVADASSIEPIVAYMGPGAGLGMLGSLLAILIAILLGVVGLVLYPITLIRRKLRTRHQHKVHQVEKSAEGSALEL